jgi:hypothetical protein
VVIMPLFWLVSDFLLPSAFWFIDLPLLAAFFPSLLSNLPP